MGRELPNASTPPVVKHSDVNPNEPFILKNGKFEKNPSFPGWFKTDSGSKSVAKPREKTEEKKAARGDTAGLTTKPADRSKLNTIALAATPALKAAPETPKGSGTTEATERPRQNGIATIPNPTGTVVSAAKQALKAVPETSKGSGATEAEERPRPNGTATIPNPTGTAISATKQALKAAPETPKGSGTTEAAERPRQNGIATIPNPTGTVISATKQVSTAAPETPKGSGTTEAAERPRQQPKKGTRIDRLSHEMLENIKSFIDANVDKIKMDTMTLESLYIENIRVLFQKIELSDHISCFMNYYSWNIKPATKPGILNYVFGSISERYIPREKHEWQIAETFLEDAKETYQRKTNEGFPVGKGLRAEHSALKKVFVSWFNDLNKVYLDKLYQQVDEKFPEKEFPRGELLREVDLREFVNIYAGALDNFVSTWFEIEDAEWPDGTELSEVEQFHARTLLIKNIDGFDLAEYLKNPPFDREEPAD